MTGIKDSGMDYTVHIDFEDDGETITMGCDCHQSFEMEIDGCDFDPDSSVMDKLNDIENVTNGLSFKDLIELHDTHA